MQVRSIARSLYWRLPEAARNALRPMARQLDRVPGTADYDRRRWIREVYTPFALNSQRQVMLSIARFCHINRPIEGYYLEFGSHEANTMRMAWDSFHHLFEWDFVAFDSFEGLPEIEPIDSQPIWEKGKLRTSEPDFLRICAAHGIAADRLRTVKGFYDESLTPALRDSLLPRKAAVVYIDCDLYASTVTVLAFVRDLLQLGTVVVFDDWNCFHARPDRGERRAFAEFRAANPDLSFGPFVETQEAKAFICTDPGTSAPS